MKILVTGGAGFIGSHLVDALVAQGHQVVVVDHHQKDKLRFPNTEAKIYKLSFQSPELADVFAKEKPDAVCHLAAQISVTRSVANPMMDAMTNIVSAVGVLDLAKKFGCKKFVFASSGGAIYGDHPERPTPEKYDTMPISPYGIGKQSFEYYLDFYRVQFGMQTIALRFSNVYGPRQMFAGEAAVIAIFLERLRTGVPAIIFGDGRTTRDYLFVRDAVQAFVKALTSDFAGTVNVATGVETSVLELWELLKDIHGHEHKLEFQPIRPGEVLRSVLSAKTAHGVLDWRPNTVLHDGLKETYNWYMETFKNQLVACSLQIMQLINLNNVQAMNYFNLTDLPKVVTILQNGGIIIFPTETSYGLGCDATNTQAVEKIFAIKGRAPLVWPFPVIVAGYDDARNYVEFSDRAIELAQKYWPGALNLVLPSLPSSLISRQCASTDGFQSVRVSANAVVAELVTKLDRPLVATSANLSGSPALYDLVDLELAFGDKLELIDGVIDVGTLPVAPASTTVKIQGDEVQVIRQGSVII